MPPFISICIPAYKQKPFLKRLLDSIELQVYRDFEVIITDDSPDDALESLTHQYSFPVAYHRNKPALGSPANWNHAIRLARGRWIKLMHNDDWFTDKSSLQKFATAAMTAQDERFIFAAHNLYYADVFKSDEKLNRPLKNALRRDPLILFRKNYIGHPSTTLIKNDLEAWYDERVKWVVDFEFYIRLLRTTGFIYIPEALVNIGLGDHQVTREAFRNPAIEVPENIYLLNKLGKNILQKVVVYDYYWRLLRNLGIRRWEAFAMHSTEPIPAEISKMFDVQRRYSLKLLRNGFVSKALMFSTYLKQHKK